MTKVSGSTLAISLMTLLVLSACGGSGGSSGLPPGDDPDVSLPLPAVSAPPVIDGIVQRQSVRDEGQLQAFRRNSPYANVLRSCALTNSASSACTLTTLPFIKQENTAFTRSDVMDRLLVTHEWMGERFEALLDAAPDNMLPLFGSITSISIGSTVRPSNYWTGTGAIQLDPDNLWLSVAEKASVSIEEDYRSGFGADLQFWSFGTLRNGNAPAINFFSLTDTTERTLDDIKLPMYRLLYHELAHAIDYLPDESVATLDATRTPNSALFRNRSFFLSERMVTDLPLYSDIMYRLGQVSFRGEDATEIQQFMTPSDVGAEMGNDGAMRYYGYSTTREDFATLFTMAMMKFSFGLDYYIGYVQKPVDESNYGCDELTVGWGSRNRLADPLVIPRVKWVFESIYGPSDEFDQFFASQVGQSEAMTPGVDWCTNRDAGPLPDSSLSGRSVLQTLSADARRAQFEQLEMERLQQLH